MFKNKRILAVIPARFVQKGLKIKILKSLRGSQLFTIL